MRITQLSIENVSETPYTTRMSLNVTRELHEQLLTVVASLWGIANNSAITFTMPDVASHGDFATNAALIAAKSMKRNPLECAAELAAHLRAQPWWTERMTTIDAAPPGFVNFFMRQDYLTNALSSYLGTLHEAPLKNKKVVIEHTNVNPNKAMHVGHLRNAVYGDVLTRVLQRAGYATEVQYYVDDTGVQVADTFVGLQELGLKPGADEKYDHYCWRIYAAITEAYETRPELLAKRTETLQQVEEGSNETAREVKNLAKRILDEHLHTMDRFGIYYDLLVWESDILQFGFWQAAFEILKKSPVFIKESEGKNAGCWVLKTGESSGDDEHNADKIIVKSDGTVTYTGKDVAYHFWKYNLLGRDFLYKPWEGRGLDSTAADGQVSDRFGRADLVYNVIDVRQSYTQDMVQRALVSLGYAAQASALRHVSYGFVSLSAKTAGVLGVRTSGDKQAHSMSGRKGIGVKVDDLLTLVTNAVAGREYAVSAERHGNRIAPHDVAVAAIKYFMLRYNPQTEIVFDFDEAVSLEGSTGPYIQYAYARTKSIIERSRGKTAVSTEPHALEHALLVKMFSWPETLARVADDLAVNAIPTYAFELATLFNSFYESCHVIVDANTVSANRLALCDAFQRILGDALAIMGITAPDAM